MDVTEMEHPGKEDNTEYWLALHSLFTITDRCYREKHWKEELKSGKLYLYKQRTEKSDKILTSQ
jgi:hypothetical protein